MRQVVRLITGRLPLHRLRVGIAGHQQPDAGKEFPHLFVL